MAADISVGSIAAYLRLNMSDFDRGVARAITSSRALSKELNASMGGIASRAKDAASATKGASGSMAASLSSAGTAASHVGNSMLLAGGVVVAALGSMVRAGSDYQKKMLDVGNNTTMTAAQIRQMQQDVEDLGAKSAAPLNQLAQGYMHVVNYGFKPGAQAATILAAATKSAIATGGDAGQAANILAANLKEFTIPTLKAAEAMNVLHLAAAQGNMTLEQFNEAAGPAFAMAANLGVGFTDTAAAMSALTRHGFNAAESATQVRNVISHIVNPAKKTREEIEKLSKATGIDLVRDFSSAGLKAKGLHGVMDDLAEVHRRTGVDIMKLIPAIRGGIGAMVLAGTGDKDYKEILTSLNDAMRGKVDPSTQGFARTQATLAAQTQVLKNNLTILASSVMTALGPSLVRLTQQLTAMVQWFNRLPGPVKSAVVDFAAMAGAVLVVGGVIARVVGIGLQVAGWLARLGPVIETVTSLWGELVFAFEAVAGGAATVGEAVGVVVAALGGPVTIAVGAVVAVVAGLALAWKNDWGHIREVTQTVVQWLRTNLGAAWEWLKTNTLAAWNWVRDGINTALSAVRSLVASVMPDIKADINEFLKWMGPQWAMEWEGIKLVVVAVWEAIKTMTATSTATLVGVIKGAWDILAGATRTVWDLLVGIVRIGWDQFAMVIKVGLKLLHGDWQGAWQAFLQGGQKIWDDLKRLFGKLLKDLVGMVLNVGRDLYNAGANAMHAFGSGIQNGIAHVGAQARSAAANVVSEIKNTLQIHSPSKVMIEIGENVVAGLRVGMANGTGGVVTGARALAKAAWDAHDKAWKEGLQASLIMQHAEEQAAQHRRRATALDSRADEIHGRGHSGARNALRSQARHERAVAEQIMSQARHSSALLRAAAAMDRHSASLDSHKATLARQNTAAAKQAMATEMAHRMDVMKAQTSLDIARSLTSVSATTGLLTRGDPAAMRQQRDSLLGAEGTVLADKRAQLKGLDAQIEDARKAGDLEKYKDLLNQSEELQVQIAVAVQQEKADRLEMGKEIDDQVHKLTQQHQQQKATHKEATDAQKKVNEAIKQQKKNWEEIIALKRESIRLSQGEYAAERYDALNDYLKNAKIDPALAAQVFAGRVKEINKDQKDEQTRTEAKEAKAAGKGGNLLEGILGQIMGGVEQKAGKSSFLMKVLSGAFGADGKGGHFSDILHGCFGADGKSGHFGNILHGAFGQDGKGGLFATAMQALLGSKGGAGGGGLGSMIGSALGLGGGPLGSMVGGLVGSIGENLFSSALSGLGNWIGGIFGGHHHSSTTPITVGSPQTVHVAIHMDQVHVHDASTDLNTLSQKLGWMISQQLQTRTA